MPDKTVHNLYRNRVIITFNPNSPNYRYVVDDPAMGIKQGSVRGVTTVIGDILDKPGLRNYPMDQALAYLLGQKWNEASKSYLYDPKIALIKPDTVYDGKFYAQALLEARGASTQRTKRGGDIGSMAHRLLELLLKNIKEPMAQVTAEFTPNPEDAKVLAKIWETMQSWHYRMVKNGMKVVSSEQVVYSRKLSYAGTLDLLINYQGASYVLDLKTTNRSQYAPFGIYPENFLQLGAYSYAFREEYGIEIGDLGIINIGKDGVINTISAKDIGLSVDDCERAFAFALRLHDFAATAKKTLSETARQPFKSVLNPPA